MARHINVPDIGQVSTEAFVYTAVAQQLEHQLDRYRDTITLAFGLVATALAVIVFLLADRPDPDDKTMAVLLLFGAIVAVIVLAIYADPQDAPDAEVLATSYSLSPDIARGRATAAMLVAMRRNTKPLELKMLLVRLALVIILISGAAGVVGKVVESSHVTATNAPAGASLRPAGSCRGPHDGRRSGR